MRFIVKDTGGIILKAGRFSANANPGTGNSIVVWDEGISPSIPDDIYAHSATWDGNDIITGFTKDINRPYLKFTLLKLDDTALPDTNADGVPEILTSGDPSEFKLKIEKMNGLTDSAMTAAGDNETLSIIASGIGYISEIAPQLVNGVVEVNFSNASVIGNIPIKVKEATGAIIGGTCSVEVLTATTNSLDPQYIGNTAEHQTSSTDYADLPNASITVNQGSGKYKVNFDAYVSAPAGGPQDLSVILSVNGVEQTGTERTVSVSVNNFLPLALSWTGDVNDAEIVKVRFKTESGSVSIYNHSFTVDKK